MSKLKKLFGSKILLANSALVLVLLLGASYLMVNVMRVNPLRSEYDVTINLDRSGGLQPGNDVTLRGHRIGKVTSVELVNDGASIAAKARIDKSYKIPVETQIQVAARLDAVRTRISRHRHGRCPRIGFPDATRTAP